MKKYEIRIDVPCFEEATTESHRVNYNAESHEKALDGFMKENHKFLESGPKVIDCVSFYNDDYYTVIPLNKISQVEVKELKK